MKKLFTLVALLAMVLGANAKWSEQPIYTIDYSTYQGFPFYVMGYVPEFDNGYMTDFGANYKYAEKKDDAEETSDVIVKTNNGTEYYRWTEGGGWHQYFIADGIGTKVDGQYKVIAKVKASAAVSININMGWGWNAGESVSASVAIPDDADFQTVEWEYKGIGGSSCNLVAQPGGATETIEWLSLEVYEWIKEGGREPVWVERLGENTDAEKTWEELGLAGVKFDDQENNFKICAWTKERGVLMNENDGWDPYPSPIEVDPDDENNHVFVVHGREATTEGDAAAWDNQFWIESTQAWKSGTQVKLSFRYKASKEVTVPTQTHTQNPSAYLIWHGCGDVKFTETWQTFDSSTTFADDMAGGWSFAFQLNQNDKAAIDFYFDDLSWKTLLLDEGYFLSGINQSVTSSYDDLDNAVQFETEDDRHYEATFGTKGDANTYVDQLMVSTTRGDDAAFKGATLYVSDKIHNDADEWLDYTPSANKRLDVPGLGVWKVYIDTKYDAMAFEMLEGTPYDEPDPVAVYIYAEELVLNGVERDDLKDEWDANKQELNVREEADNNPDDEHGLGGAGHEGQTWDNQFFIKADRALAKGEKTKLVFKYKSSVDAKTTTQCHGEEPGAYMHYAAIGDVNFVAGDYEDFEQEFTVPAEADGMWNIAFNMAEIKEACDYYIKDVQWYLVDSSLDDGMTYENLISGKHNFYFKVGAGTTPALGIENVNAKTAKTSGVIYNLAGQRVNNNFKGLVIKDGKKIVK